MSDNPAIPESIHQERLPIHRVPRSVEVRVQDSREAPPSGRYTWVANFGIGLGEATDELGRTWHVKTMLDMGVEISCGSVTVWIDGRELIGAMLAAVAVVERSEEVTA